MYDKANKKVFLMIKLNRKKALNHVRKVVKVVNKPSDHAHGYLMAKSKWYKTWHENALAHRVHSLVMSFYCALVLLFIGNVIFIQEVKYVYAETGTDLPLSSPSQTIWYFILVPAVLFGLIGWFAFRRLRFKKFKNRR
ncbi:hypothetical protein HGB25_00760 [Candidatus Saccharibacteria bacterium]|nr:hypothetical protein [Candidatus Saccharibacteria bacterium]